MKVNKKQLEAMIRESVEEEISNLNEEELDELLGGLKGLAGAAGAGLKRAGQAAAGAAQKAGTAAAGAVRGAGQAVAGVAGQAAGAVKGAYQAGERNSLIQGLNKSIQNTVAVADKAIQSAGGDQNLINALDQVKQIVAHAGEQMKTEKLAEALKEGKKPIKPGKILRRKTK
jgi:hypothetical protein